ncbi:MAG: hypothetical protein B6I20_08410 [Bacteroidetes bacterium 4572_117]|nr:MAG: hypothetical protein B6I20_08410 [Bacteroidetes bacterium 4572_117]
MQIRLTEERDIESLDDLRFKKEQLRKKADKKAKKLRKKVKKMVSDANTPAIYDEILSQFDLQHGLMNMLPLVLKYREQIGNMKFIRDIKNSPQKRFAAITFGTIGAGLITYFNLLKKHNSDKGPKTQAEEKKAEVPTDKIDGLFV